MPRKNEGPMNVVPEADAVVRAVDFFKPVWEVPKAKASAAGEESQPPESRRVDGEG